MFQFFVRNFVLKVFISLIKYYIYEELLFYTTTSIQKKICNFVILYQKSALYERSQNLSRPWKSKWPMIKSQAIHALFKHMFPSTAKRLRPIQTDLPSVVLCKILDFLTEQLRDYVDHSFVIPSIRMGASQKKGHERRR